METQTEQKFKMPEMRQFLVLIPFALFYAVAAILGEPMEAAAMGIPKCLVRFGAWFGGSYVIMLVLCALISQRGSIAARIPFLARIPARKKRPEKWYIGPIFTLVCMIGYIPYFLMYYPTWLNNDAVWQIQQAMGIVPSSNHHPFFHTLILKVFITIGYRLYGSYAVGAAFYTFFQMLVMASVFSFLLYQFYKKGTRWIWLILALLFYAALPVNALLTICMGKDEFFTAVLLIFTWMTAEFNLEKETPYQWQAYFTVGFLLCLLRSNGRFIYFGTMLAVMASIWRKKDKKTNKRKFPFGTFTVVLAVGVSCLIYFGPLLRSMAVWPADIIEGLTMPTQHVLCAYVKGGELTEEEIELIDAVAPVEDLADHYNPWLFDIAKNYIREEGDQWAIARQPGEYLKLWVRVGLRNPVHYILAEIRQTSGYWAYSTKDYQYLYGEYFTVDNPFGITTERKVFTYDQELAMHDFLMGFQDLFNRFWSIGLNTWLMVFGLAYVVYNRKRAVVYAPYVSLLISLLLATPVYHEFRYAYGLFAAFPLLFSYTFGETKPEEEETSDGKEKAAGMKPLYKPLEKAEGKVPGAETLRNGHKDEKME